MQQNSWSYWLN